MDPPKWSDLIALGALLLGVLNYREIVKARRKRERLERKRKKRKRK